MPLPTYPILFYKPPTSIGGPFDPIPVPAMAQEVEGLDYECELVAVIGKEAREVPESKALEYVLGYSVGNDVSHREWQLKRGGGQWANGKGFDGWAPYGPGLVSRDLIKDPQNLRIKTLVNGKTVQDSTTKDMVFGVAKTIAFLSQGTTLLPGGFDLDWDVSIASLFCSSDEVEDLDEWNADGVWEQASRRRDGAKTTALAEGRRYG